MFPPVVWKKVVVFDEEDDGNVLCSGDEKEYISHFHQFHPREEAELKDEIEKKKD